MIVMKAENIAVEFDGNVIFEKANLEIHQGEHVALIGRNGVGKTTFIHSLMGMQATTKGTVHHAVPLERWGIVLQDSRTDEELSVRSFIEKENRTLFEAKKRVLDGEQEIQEAPDSLERISCYSDALERYQDLGGYQWEASVETWMVQLGIPKALWNEPVRHLSGGQKTRAKLARVMQNEPECLLLDEPTNHLDRETIDWLADWLHHYKGTVLFISHERSFIDRVADLTYELSEEGTKKYLGGYSHYKKQKEHEWKTAEAAYEKQQSEKRKLTEAVTNYRQWFQKAHNAASERDPFAKKGANKNMTRFKAKEAALERLEKEKVEKPKETAKIKVDFEDHTINSKTLARFEGVTFRYRKGTPLFEEITFTIERKDRIAVIGKNGTGKTTLLNLITGQLTPLSGKISRHPHFRPGYFMQELEGLKPNATILDQILALPGMTESQARTILACFLFRRDAVFKRVKELSMGEKCRVAFVKLYFSDANLLVLDEPTNYLDIETRERIEEALSIYPGAVVTVSHDDYKLEKVANRVVSLDNGFYDYRGSFKEWKGHHQRTSAEQSRENELERLKLELTSLVTAEIEAHEHEHELLHRIQHIKKEITRLEG